MNRMLFIVPLQLNLIVGYNACRGSEYSAKSGSWEGDVFNLLALMRIESTVGKPAEWVENLLNG